MLHHKRASFAADIERIVAVTGHFSLLQSVDANSLQDRPIRGITSYTWASIPVKEKKSHFHYSLRYVAQGERGYSMSAGHVCFSGWDTNPDNRVQTLSGLESRPTH